MEKIIKIRPAYDKRDADDRKNYGIGSFRLWMILKGSKGAVQCVFSFPLFLPETVSEYLRIGNKGKTSPTDLRDDYDGKPKGIDCHDVGYHAKEAQWEGQTSMDCDLIEGGKCYYDGSSLRGQEDKVGDMLLREGDEAVWAYLEKDYKARFGEDSIPTSVKETKR